MATGSDYKVHVDKLEGPEDWAKWKWHMSMVLRAYELENLVIGSRERPELPASATVQQRVAYQQWLKDDAKAASLLAGALSKPVAELVLTCTNASDIWKKLSARFERSSTQRLNMLIESFFRVTRDAKEDISTHVAKLQKLFVDLNDELQKHDENILSERILNGRILSTLGKEYDNFKDLWDTIPSEIQTVNLLIEKLCTIELREQEKVESTAFSARGGPRKKFQQNRSDSGDKSKKRFQRAKERFPCHKCKQLGHWAAECPVRKTDVGAGNKYQSCGPVAFLSYVMGASVDNFVEADKWYCDSGATNHITANKQYFETYVKFAVPEKISLGKRGVNMLAHGEGTVKIQVRLHNAWSNAVLKNVLYVPEASAHLFSVKAAARRGFSTRLDDRRVSLEDSVTGERMMTGYVSHGLYVLDMRVVKPAQPARVNVVTASDTLQVYHERFGHQHKQHVKNVLKQMKISVDGCKEEFCDGCALGKMHRLPFKKRVNRPSVTGEQIHADVNGPMSTESLGKARYYVCFKDDFSKFRRVFFLKQKSEVSIVLEQFLNEAKTNGHVIKQLRCDGGKEFDNKKFSEQLANRGIEHCITSPYTPQQNGVAERENRTIVECARSMLNPSKLPKALWAEACNTATYLLNRTGKSSVENKSPYELWYGRPVGSLSHLKIFGTECYVHINKNFRSKFDDKAVPGHLVGYVNDRDGFRVWIPAQRKIVLSRDVKFKSEVVCNTRANADEFEVSCEELLERSQPSSSSVILEKPEEVSHDERKEDLSELEECNSAPSSGGSQISEDEEKETKNTEEKRKSKRESKKPTWMTSGDCVYMAGSSIIEHKEPNSYFEVLQSSDKNHWLKAVHEELESLKENDTWVLVRRPDDVQILQNRWVLRQKISDCGNVRFKARLVAKGYGQRQGIDYEETFSPVARYDTIRTLLAVAAAKGMKLDQFDVKTAFLNGVLEEDVYMEQPEGFEDNTGRVCLLKRSLYGLKQAPRCWNKRFTKFMKKAGFQNSNADPCLFYRKSNKNCLYVAIYVDDGLVVGSDRKDIEEFMKMLQLEFHTTRGSLRNYLGMKVQQHEDGSITINQEDYIRKILERYRMAESNGISTPSGREESDEGEKITAKVPYREAVGSLMYLTTASRPDIAFAVHKAARAMEDPTVQDWNQVKRIFRYLKSTTDHGIVYRKGEALKVYSDADYAGDKKTRRSTTGVIATFSHGAVSWTSQLQKSVATSTTEAEIISASEGAKELIWLKRLLSELLEPAGKSPTLYIDNASAVKLARNPEYHRKSKHIEVRYFYVRERFLNGDLQLEHIDGTNQLADLLTKPLERVRFEMLRERIGVQKITSADC